MKTTKYTLFLFTFAFLLFTFSVTFAQMTVKDGDDNTLLQVNDYGTSGTVTLLPFTGILPTLPINNQMLYNFDGTLYFNGSALGTSNNATGWTHSGTNIYNTTLTDNVGIGTNNPQSKLSVGGDGELLASISGIFLGVDGAGVYGEAKATGNVFNRGGIFISRGNSGEGVFGYASAIGNVENHGGSFQADGTKGRGVYGRASSSSNSETNYGGYFSSLGAIGIGVYGEATATGNFQNYGGYFTASGIQGSGVYGKTTGTSGKAVFGEATGLNAYAGYFNGRGYFSGNVGIGLAFDPAYTLDVSWNEANNFIGRFENTSTSINADGIVIDIDNANPTGGNRYLWFRKAGDVSIGSISGNGGGVDYNTTSDARLKTNIKEYSNALVTISEIGIKKYERIANPGTEEIGVIAQELQKVYPQAVSGSPYSDVKTDPMMVDYSKLTPLLVKGMQEQQELIKTQDMRIKELEEKLSKIESLLDGKRFTSVSK